MEINKNPITPKWFTDPPYLINWRQIKRKTTANKEKGTLISIECNSKTGETKLKFRKENESKI